MTNATHVHSHAHDHPGQTDHAEHSHAPVSAPAWVADSPRPSMLEASAAARVWSIAGIVAALWAGVYWALH